MAFPAALALAMTALPDSEQTLQWEEPAMVGTYEDLFCAVRCKEMLEPPTPHPLELAPGASELFLFSSWGRKWR